MAKHRPASIPSELIEQKIYLIRGHKVMVDADLAKLYGVTTGNLNLAVRRNPKRFPEDFMFQLSQEEGQSLLLQNARAKGRGGRARNRTPSLSRVFPCSPVFSIANVQYLSRTEYRDVPINDKVAPAQIAAVRQWGTHPGERFAYLENIKQPTLVVSGNHDVIVYTVNSLYLVQNMPNAKLILYPDANHGSWYENHEDFVFETNRFLNESDRIATVTTGAADD